MLPYLKNPRTLDDSLTILALRGMHIPDREHARRTLIRLGYYRLSAYWYPFRDFCPLPDKENELVRCDQFKSGTTFDHAVNFYLFDKALRLTLLDAIERLEIVLRTILVETLAAMGTHSHRDARSYRSAFAEPDKEGKVPLFEFVKGLDQQFTRSKEEFAKHFTRKYSGNPPIWVAAGTWDWGNLTHIITNLADRHKLTLAREISKNLPVRNMISWVSCLNEVRNSCAHHSRTWNKPLINSPSFPPKEDFNEFSHIRNARGQINDSAVKRLYGAVVVMIFLLRRFFPRTQWHIRLKDQIRSAALPHEVSIASAGFPEGWDAQPIWN